MIQRRRTLSGSSPRLPSDYQEVEWVGGNGGSKGYINTNWTPTTNCVINIKYSFSQFNGSDDEYVYGHDNFVKNQRFNLYAKKSNYTGLGYGTGYDENISVPTLGATYEEQCTYSGRTVTMVGTVSGSYTATKDLSFGYNLYLFARNGYGSAGYYSYARIYYMKISSGGTVIRNFIPCYRKSDGAIGLYDLENDTFYGNSGKGTLLKGANVN